MFVIDRIEGSFVICENLSTGETLDFCLASFPQKVCEGEFFEIIREEIVMVKPSKKQTFLSRVKEKMDSLWQ